jgi:hypothetical protein
MRFGIHKVALVILFASMLLFAKGQRAEAQEETPDLHMLLNLDLFGAPSKDSSPPGAGDSGNETEVPSMLDQIRALNAMGYLAKGGQPPVTPAGNENDGSPEGPPAGGEAPQL